MIDLNQIKQRIHQGEEIEKIVEKIDWKEFEKLIAEILKNHDFKVFNNFRFKTERRYEVDIIASNKNIVLVIDCKQWNRGRYKKTGLKYAVTEQKNRVKELKKFVKNNPIVKNKFKISKKTKFIPLIITWFEEDLIEYEKTLIIPIWKFNQFLLDLSEYS